PARRVERDTAGVMVAPDNQQLLAGRAVPTRRMVVESAAVHVQALDDREARKRTALYNPPTHTINVGSALVIVSPSATEPRAVVAALCADRACPHRTDPAPA